MNIENILSFIYVYRYNSFRKAANVLYVTQPSLSSRINTLEKELNTRLLVRNKAKIELTEDGEKFLPYALQLISIYTQAQKALDKGGETIVIGTNISISSSIIPYAYRLLHQKYPNVSIEIVTGMPGDLPNRLLQGECHFLVTEGVDHPDVERIAVYRDPIRLIVPKGHAFAARPSPPDLVEVAHEPLIRVSSMADYWEIIQEHFKKCGVAPQVALSVDSLEIARNMVLQGLGLAFMPLLSLEAELLNRSLVAIAPTPKIDLHRKIEISYRRDRVPPHLDYFAELFQRYGND